MIGEHGGGNVSKRKKNSYTSAFWLKLLSIILFLIAITGLFGAFGFFLGRPVNYVFTLLLKSWSWAGPFLCFVLAFFLWVHASNADASLSTKSITYSAKTRAARKKTQTRSKKENHKLNQKHMRPQTPKSKVQLELGTGGLSLPSGKLVNLKGFNEYFSSSEWPEITETPKHEELEELGRDFPSYFAKGKVYLPKGPRKMTELTGFKDYFEEVSEEMTMEETRQAASWDTLSPEMNQAETLHAEKTVSNSVFESDADQQAFLARFKDEEFECSERDDQAISPIQAVQAARVIQTGLVEQAVSSTSQASQEFSFSNPKIEDKTLEELEKHAEQQPEFAPLPKEESISRPVYAGQVTQLVQRAQEHERYSTESRCENSISLQKHWVFPELHLLEPIPSRLAIQDTETPKLLENVLQDFGVKAKVIRVAKGPVITRYELAPAPGVKISKIVNLADDIALGLAARDVRIEAPIPGKAAVGIEVPNKQARPVPFREVLETTSFSQHSSKLKIALGKDIADQPVIADLAKMPHLLVAGATGSGKSVCITTIINSILFQATPAEVKFLLVDPKMVELSHYNGIPHLLAPVVIDPKKAASALKWIVKEMENRYELFAAAGVRDIERYNKLKAAELGENTPALPFFVVIIDELADLMMVAAGEVEEAICRLAQMARAAGIHLVIATQRPSVDVITGVIKANIPSRISFAVSSQIDSRTILDATGAEKLLGRGDMLYSPLGVNKPLRVQGCLVTDDEVQRVIQHWKTLGKPEYLDPERLFVEAASKAEESNGPDDELFIDAGQLIIKTGMASVSFLQRRLKLGYARAARLMDMLEEEGVVGAYEGSKPRQVLLSVSEFNERFSL